jgi:hypothetical protein
MSYLIGKLSNGFAVVFFLVIVLGVMRGCAETVF